VIGKKSAFVKEAQRLGRWAGHLFVIVTLSMDIAVRLGEG